jgi:hypothetical protein
MGRFETEVLTQPGNLKALTKLSGKWIDRLRERQPMRELILDMDSSVSETYGEQEGTAFNLKSAIEVQPVGVGEG